MKHLKKILFAVLILAVLVSSAVTIALAEGEEYTGDLTNAKTLLDTIGQREALIDKYTAAQDLADYLELMPIDPNAQIVVGGQKYTYADFEAEYAAVLKSLNESSYDEAEKLYNALKDSASIADYEAAREKFLNYLAGMNGLEYSLPAATDIYPGELSIIEAKLATINAKSTYEYKKALVAEIYTYLKATPVNPTTDAYYEFYTKYVALADDVGATFSEKVDKEADIAKRAALINEFKAYLTATPVSQSLVNLYNDKVTEVKSNYATSYEVINGLQTLDDTAKEVEYEGTVEALNILIAAYNEAEAFADKSTAFAATYLYFMGQPIDPASEGYKAAVDAYVAVRDDMGEALMEYIDEKDSIAEKITAIDVVRAYLVNTPVSKAVIDSYNAKVREVAKICKDVVTVLSKPNMTINYPDSAGATTFIPKENLDKFIGAVNAATTLEERKAATAMFYTLIRGANVNVSVPEVKEILEEYAEKRDALIFDLMATVENADAAKKITALKAVKEYLEKAPLSTAAVKAYNAKVDELVTDAKENAEMKISNSYTEIEALIALITEEATKENIDNFALLYLKVEGLLKDITDPANETVLEAYEAVCAKMPNVLNGYIDRAVSAEEYRDAVIEVRDYLKAYPFSEEAFSAYETKLALSVQKFLQYQTNLESPANAVLSVFDKFTELQLTFEETEDYEVKKETYGKILKLFAENYLDATDDKYEACMFNYNRVTLAMVNAFNAYVLEKTVPTEKAAVISGMYEFIVSNPNVPVSVITAYNAKYTEAVGYKYNEAKEAVTDDLKVSYTDTMASVYEAFKAEIQAIIDATVLDEEALGIVKPSRSDFPDDEATEDIDEGKALYEEALKKYYEELAEKHYSKASDFYAELVEIVEELEASVIDIVSIQHKETLELFTKAKNEVSALYTSLIEYSADQSAQLDAMYATVSQNSIASSFVETYNECLRSLAQIEFEEHDEKFNAYVAIFNDLHKHLLDCRIDTTKLGQEKLAKYKATFKELAALDHLVVLGYITQFENVGIISSKYEFIRRTNVIDELNDYVFYHPFPAEYEKTNEIMAAVNKVRTDYAKQKQENIDYLNSLVHPDEYQKTASVNSSDRTFETASDSGKYSATGTTMINAILKDEIDGNSYWRWGGKNPHVNPKTNKNAYNGVVIEWDMRFVEWTESGDSSNSRSYFVAQWAEDGLDTGARVFPYLFYIRESSTKEGYGSIYSAHGQGVDMPSYLVEDNAIKLGTWHKYTLVTDVKNYTAALYIDHVHVGTWSIKSHENFNTTCFRPRPYGAIIDMDNIKYFQGTQYRTYDYLDKMTDSDKFKYYMSFITDPNADPMDKNCAYINAKALVSAVKNDSSCAELIEAFMAFNYNEEILSLAQEENYKRLKALADEISLDTTSANTATQALRLSEVETFIKENASYLDQSTKEYSAIVSLIADTTAEIQRVDYLVEMIEAMRNFARATTLDSMQRHYNTAINYYNLIEFDVEKNAEKCLADPLVAKFEEDFKTTLYDYFDITMTEGIAEYTKIDNAKRIVDAVKIIKSLANYEATEEFFKANEEFIEKYVNVINDILDTDNYDTSYAGFSEALSEHGKINPYFYSKKRAAQLEEMKELLDRYPLTTSYIEKAGICTYLTNFIRENRITKEDAGFPELLARHEAYVKETELYKETYSEIVEQNTTAFVAFVKQMAAYTEYKDIKPLYENAASYYYNMNIDSEEAAAAIEQFEYYGEFVKATEADSQMFIDYVKTLNSSYNKAAKYRALVNCAQYRDKACADIEGVSAAIEIYEAKLAEYMTNVNSANADIEAMSGVVCSVRTNKVAAAVLAVIKSLFSK